MPTYTPAEIAKLRKESSAKALQIILSLRARGHSLEYIAQALTREGIAPTRGLPGQTWFHTSVNSIIKRHAAQSRSRAA
jgi:hypothetical protein